MIYGDFEEINFLQKLELNMMDYDMETPYMNTFQGSKIGLREFS